jgi:catechol 2,3-dioxygenase-like lactoylglutathione lyase family enzyme
MTALVEPATEAQTPRGLNHVVLNVRNLEESHRFWTGLLGFRHVGTLRRTGPDGKPRARMRFYSGERDGNLTTSRWSRDCCRTISPSTLRH